MVTVSIDHELPGGAPAARMEATVTARTGPAGAALEDRVVGQTRRIRLDAAGHAEIDLDPVDVADEAIVWQIRVGNVTRHLDLSEAAGPVSWADPAVLVLEGPAPTDWVPVQGLQGDPGVVAATGLATYDAETQTIDVTATAADVGADAAGTAASEVSAHAIASDPHGDRDYTDTAVAAAITDIGALPAADPLDGTEEIPAEQSGTGVSITTETLTAAPVDVISGRSRTRNRWATDFTGFMPNASYTANVLGAEHFQIVTSGASAAITQVGLTTFRRGVAGCATGSTTTGRAAVCSLELPLFWLAALADIDLAWVATVSALSDGTNTYTVELGLVTHDGNGRTTAVATQGIFFRYNSAVSPNWYAITKNLSGETPTDTAVAVSTAAWPVLEVSYSPGGPALFLIDGVQVASHATHFPAEFTSLVNAASIYKSAGGTSRSLYVDKASFDAGGGVWEHL